MIIDITCPNCDFSRKVPEEKIPQGVRWDTCPRCKKTFEFYPYREASTRSADGNIYRQIVDTGNSPSPWERRSDLGLLKGIWQTFKLALFSPAAFYGKMGRIDNLREPMAYGMLVGSIGTMLGLFWEFLNLSRGLHPLTGLVPNGISMNLIFLITIILSPLLVAISIFITGCLIHLFLLIFRGDGNGFNGTFRVIAFSQSTSAFNLIPGIGVIIGFIWNLIVIVIGLKFIHDSSYFRSFMAVLPLLILKLIKIFILAVMSGLFKMVI